MQNKSKELSTCKMHRKSFLVGKSTNNSYNRFEKDTSLSNWMTCRKKWFIIQQSLKVWKNVGPNVYLFLVASASATKLNLMNVFCSVTAIHLKKMINLNQGKENVKKLIFPRKNLNCKKIKYDNNHISLFILDAEIYLTMLGKS